ncbi:hypothetical protein CEUSTIGMA_g198.t1 [Chlamydomonas eustigma]|uniref:Translation initiation factor eIF2B subunit gamma n=1 Tax=Chlamydomonas eustigma TaxID=1157962 RepID=A0A250WQ07_9CHLO|nr:hypothetical protein CEUSTIGMA_g198.t1 [Chlamydomonas eustigma]|eukprot:GAX72742.1 hypothetical protein CEUSTIGMA_g198.t1 [Chlamydomonas eustigma]
MPSAGLGFQGIILAGGGGDDKQLFPLSAGTPKALLPVANKPLLSYPLKTLSDAGLKTAFVIVSGEKASAAISSWLQTEYPATTNSALHCEVITVPEDYGTADALRSVASKITASTLVVISGDLLTDVPVNALVASHQMHRALATVMLCPRKVSPASETKPGKPPKNVDYIGLDLNREHLLFYTSSPDAVRDLKVPLSMIRERGAMTISSDLVDAHLYIFDRSLLLTLENQGSLNSLRQDLMPYLTLQHMKAANRYAATNAADSIPVPTSPSMNMMQRQVSVIEGEGGLNGNSGITQNALPGSNYVDMAHSMPPVGGALSLVSRVPPSGSASSAPSSLRVHVVQHSNNYCARVTSHETFGEVNREVADPNVALHLSGLRPSKYDNIVATTTTLGNKATVASACIVGENSVLGDKSSIKRSVLGNGIRLGTNAKVINSVLMDNVVVGDNCTVQNSILATGVQLKERASVKDCQVGPGYTIPAGVEYKGEVLAKTAK